MRSLAITLTTLALAAGCVPPIPDGHYACVLDVECPGGFSCVAGRCSSPGVSERDGGATGGDAATPADATAPTDASAATVDGGSATGPTDLAVGARHACVVTRDGAVLTWGDNSAGALGVSVTTPSSATPVVVPSVPVARSACAGIGFTCVLTRAGDVWCWGASDTWQLGRSVPSPAPPGPVDGVHGATLIACGGRHACAATGEGVTCWGADELGQAGSAPTPRIEPHRVTSTPAVALTAGAQHTCALGADGTVSCWGAHTMGQLGPDAGSPTTIAFSAAPIEIASLRATAIAAGAQHTCAVRDDGRVICWGRADGGRIGFAGSGAHPMPELVEGADLARLVAGGDELSCATSDSGVALRCWGSTAYGQLGVGGALEAGSEWTAVPVASMDTPVDRVDAGAGFGCAITGATVVCWGLNDRGQLGDGTTTTRTAPVEVLLPPAL